MKKIMLIVIVAISLSMVGCSSVGNKKIKDKEFISKNVKKGNTKNEVRSALGEPTNVDFLENGNEKWTYIRSETDIRATSFIPIISMFAGGYDSNVDKLYILFDEDEKVLRVTTTSIKGGSGSVFD